MLKWVLTINNRGGFLLSAGALFAGGGLVACGSPGSVLLPRAQAIQKSSTTMVTPGCSICLPAGQLYPDGTASLGGITVSYHPDSVSTTWAIVGGTHGMPIQINQRFSGALFNGMGLLGSCAVDNSAMLLGFAWKMFDYISANYRTFVSFTEALGSGGLSFQAGAMTAVEYIGAIVASMSVAEVLAVILAVGLSAAVVFTLYRCVARKQYMASIGA